MRAMGHDGPVGRRQAAQAAEFVRALRDQLEEMVLELAWVERQRLKTYEMVLVVPHCPSLPTDE